MPLYCSTLQLINKGILPPSEQQIPPSNLRTSFIFRRSLKRDRDSVWVYRSTNGRAIRVLANPNASSTGRRSARKEIIMVDPLEAKRLAAKQMELIKANERLKRRRQIEAINGAWALIGLTAGLVIEGETGKGILSQLAGYWAAIIGLLSINDLLNNAQSFFGNSP